MSLPVQYLKINPNIEIAYTKLTGREPGVIFCSGFMSDMQGAKATAVETFCQENGLAFIRFDYRGHGLSKGAITQVNISAWLEDALAVLDNLTQGRQIAVGSSMGGWIALLMAKARPTRIKKLIGIAAAPDFTEDLIWERLSDEMQQRLLNDETLAFPSAYSDRPYAITQQFIEDGRKHLLLRAPINLHCPVHLLQGMQDADVPWRTSMKLIEKIAAPAVNLTLIKDGDHRLSRDQDLALLKGLLADS